MTITRVANLKTSRPFIFTKLLDVRRTCASRCPAARGARRRRRRRRARSRGSRRSSTRSRTTAPAPSPKSTSVERSVQSRIFESTSPPTTSARCDRPAADHRRTPARSRTRSRCSRRAGRRRRRRVLPSVSARSAEVVGNIMSGVTVAQTSRSMSSPSSAGLLERVARGGKRDVRQRLVVARRCGARGCPVRSMIHSSVRVDERRQLVVRQHAIGHVAAEAR